MDDSLFRTFIEQHMYLSSKLRVINKVLRKWQIREHKKGDYIKTWEFLQFIHYILYTHLHRLEIYVFRDFGQTFCGMGRIPNDFIPFSPTETAFPNLLIDS